jgi:hypothetical protein
MGCNEWKYDCPPSDDILEGKGAPMNSTLNPATSSPDNVLVARADERLAHAYEQIASADEQLARLTEQLSKLERDAARPPSAVLRRRPSRGLPMLRGFIGFVLAASIFAAAFASRSPYGEAATLKIAQWAPYIFPASSLKKPVDSTQSSPAVIQMASAEATSPLPASSAQTTVQDVPPTPAPVPPELTQLLQTMAHDIAVVEQGIEQLKASQDQMAADNAKAIEQLRASQEQLTRLVAKSSVPDPRAKTPEARPAVASAAHKPPPPAQARARPQPTQLRPTER